MGRKAPVKRLLHQATPTESAKRRKLTQPTDAGSATMPVNALPAAVGPVVATMGGTAPTPASTSAGGKASSSTATVHGYLEAPTPSATPAGVWTTTADAGS